MDLSKEGNNTLHNLITDGRISNEKTNTMMSDLLVQLNTMCGSGTSEETIMEGQSLESSLFPNSETP